MATDLVPIRDSDFVHRSGIGPKTVGDDDPGSGRCQTNGHGPRAATGLSSTINLCREGPPLLQCGQPSLLVNLSGDQMAFQIEVVSDLIVN